MELCLYHPDLGYYSRAAERFGKAGDFYTSSDVHAVFGRLLARQFEQMWRVLGSPARIDLVELGPGRGLFARDVLDWSMRQFPEFAAALRYTLAEQSGVLRERLQQGLEQHIREARAAVAPSLQEDRFGENLILFANEFFDALPIEIIDHRGSVRVGEASSRFVEEFVPVSEEELDFLQRYSLRPAPGERIEVSLASLEWVRRIAGLFESRTGFAVLVDYGYTREQQLAGRFRDTLMTYRRHTATASPYEAPGEQDITTHVNFTALKGAADDCGMSPLELLTQSQFLLGIGESTQFADAFRDCRVPQEQAKVALQLNHLISPEGMGEVFQVLLLSRRVASQVKRPPSWTA
jgi:SAM-dependent MidA family methyltransferase